MTDQSKENINATFKKENIEQELKDLKDQYLVLLKELKSTKENDKKINDLQESIKSMQHEFEDINESLKEISRMSKTMEEITEKINSIADEGQEKRNKPMFRNIFRRAAIRTVGSALTVVDMTMEKASLAKEGIEDIVAEAQYENRRKRMNMNRGMNNHHGMNSIHE